MDVCSVLYEFSLWLMAVMNHGLIHQTCHKHPRRMIVVARLLCLLRGTPLGICRLSVPILSPKGRLGVWEPHSSGDDHLIMKPRFIASVKRSLFLSVKLRAVAVLMAKLRGGVCLSTAP